MKKQHIAVIFIVGFGVGILTDRGFNDEDKSQQALVSDLRLQLENLKMQYTQSEKQLKIDRFLPEKSVAASALTKNADLVNEQNRSNRILQKNRADNIPTLSNNSERLAWAHEAILNGSVTQRIYALQLMITLDPVGAASSIRTLALQARTDESLSGVVAHGVLQLAKQKDYLMNTDLNFIFEQGNPALQKISAKALAERGDSSLVNRYVADTSSSLQSKYPQQRSNTLRDMSMLGDKVVIPYAVNALNDADTSVKLEALNVIELVGDKMQAENVEILLRDGNPSVRQQAQKTIQTLRGQQGVANLALGSGRLLPGLPADGFPPDTSTVIDSSQE